MTSQFNVPAPKTRRRSSEQVAADRRLVGRIRASLERNPAAVVRALELLFAEQTRDEQAAHVTRHDNERGFSQADANTGSWLVTTVITEGRAQGREDADLLRGKALAMGRRIAGKYARTQLLRAAKAKQAAADYEAELAKVDAERQAEAVVSTPEVTTYVDEDGNVRVPYYVTARLMAGPNPSDEEAAFWDAWKDEMKERY